MARWQGGRAARWAGRTAGGLAVGILMLAPAWALAGDVEYRDYGIYVDGKPCGSYQMTIDTRDPAQTHFAGRAQVTVSRAFGVYKYTYTYQGTETWAGTRLTRLDSTTNDNGKQMSVAAAADGDRLRIGTGGQQRFGSPDVWPTTYWRLPDARFRNQNVTLLDADTGREIAAQLHYVGPTQVQVAGQGVPCSHYRVTGGVQVKLWYDAQERLVRQDSIEEGHTTVIQLTRVRR